MEIDKINKPKLPIVAGHLSLGAAKVVISLALVAGTVLGLMPGPFASPGLAVRGFSAPPPPLTLHA